ncbi:MAG TPA: hypothetical protein VEB64_10660 [Azospirillaceae bacterium]|nr:hypothetical protein [Azospirillaceae bacterium]
MLDTATLPTVSERAQLTLLDLADAAYSNDTAQRRRKADGWHLLSAAELGITLRPGERFSNGLYTNGNAAALVAAARVNGRPTLALVFRGSDDRRDWINNIADINANYTGHARLIRAVDRLVAAGQFGRVWIAGHSLGGAMAQMYMARHPDGTTPYRAFTYGAAGYIQPADTPDSRIVNYRMSADPIPALGDNRELLGERLRGLPPFFRARVLNRIAERIPVEPEISARDLRTLLPSVTENYEMRGRIVTLRSPGGATVPDFLSNLTLISSLNDDQHRVETYRAALETRLTPSAAPPPATAMARLLDDGAARPLSGGGLGLLGRLQSDGLQDNLVSSPNSWA